MQITEKILLLITAAITTIAALFCVISLSTSGWPAIGSIGLFCRGCPSTPAGLSIIAFILLIIAIVVLILFVLNVLPKLLRSVAFGVLFLATIFTLSAYTSFVDPAVGYSFKLMVTAHFFTYVASFFTAFWLGGSYATRVVTPYNS
ncbi:unnamed protein product [Adineta ricciae]|uniref:Uncharacterized protein n=1 Tax=Adineta ricciae TaxID=249248 RepID=A0A813QVZ1_ADIRI|nr:unnamed protein product [Adineta ricciae]CAF1163582.1 unnamed protein product [Adineta ricciae]